MFSEHGSWLAVWLTAGVHLRLRSVISRGHTAAQHVKHPKMMDGQAGRQAGPMALWGCRGLDLIPAASGREAGRPGQSPAHPTQHVYLFVCLTVGKITRCEKILMKFEDFVFLVIFVWKFTLDCLVSRFQCLFSLGAQTGHFYLLHKSNDIWIHSLTC